MRIAFLVFCFWLALFPPVFAQDSTYTFDIPSQDLGSALRAFARASHQQVAFKDEVVAGKHNEPLRGGYTLADALSRLLKGSGLTVEKGQSGLCLIRDPSQPLPSIPSSSDH